MDGGRIVEEGTHATPQRARRPLRAPRAAPVRGSRGLGVTRRRRRSLHRRRRALARASCGACVPRVLRAGLARGFCRARWRASRSNASPRGLRAADARGPAPLTISRASRSSALRRRAFRASSALRGRLARAGWSARSMRAVDDARARGAIVAAPLAGHHALRRVGDRFGDQRTELGRARHHAARGLRCGVGGVESGVADLRGAPSGWR